MKKLSSLLILLFIAQLAIAQGTFTKKIASSNEDIANEKKKDLPKTWIARGGLFAQVAEEPVSGLITGMDKTMVTLQMKGQKPSETKQWKSPDGEEFEMQSFPDKDLYFNATGVLAFWIVKKTEVENPLQQSLEAYQKAEQLDPKAATNKDLKGGYESLAKLYSAQATGAYMLGDNAVALEAFKGVYAVNSSKPVAMVDTLTMYNIGFLASATGNTALAEEFYKKAIDNGYTKDGGLYANLADAMNKNGKKKEAEALLADAYTKYPTSQGITIGLINFYMQGGEDPLKVLPYIKKAQENEPTNASLDYAEGMLYDKLGDVEKAAAAYQASIKKDPKNFYAQYSLGALYYNQAVEYGKKADLLPINDQAGYDNYVKLINESLRKSIVPFEAAYAIEPNESIVESLKNVYYRFVDESPEMKAKYEKYEALLKQLQQK